MTSIATASSSPAAPASLVLEELEHAKARGARIYGEIVGYGATSDGYDMVAPSGEGAERCMQHGAVDGERAESTTSTRTPPRRRSAIRRRSTRSARSSAGDKCPPISATKSLTGHSLGATGVQEAIYSLLMMNNGFICESANIEELDPAFADMPIVRKRIDNVKVDTVLSNSFGFGGTNATLVLQTADASRLGASRRSYGMRSRMGVEQDPDERQARPDHGRRQRSFDRLGHCADASPRRAPSSPSPIRAKRSASASSRSPQSLGSDLVLPCDVEDDRHRVDTLFADARAQLGQARFPRPRHRLLRQERAEGPLRRHHAREFRAHHGDLLLLLHRGGASAPRR